MNSAALFESRNSPSADLRWKFDRLQQIIERAAHRLPSQGPISTFIHHNTLHALEGLRFQAAVAEGSKVFGCNAYLSEDRYRDQLAKGRIRGEDLEAILCRDLGPEADVPVLPGCRRIDLRLAMLRYPLRAAPSTELRWFFAEMDALRKFRTDAPDNARQQFLDEARHWAMRDLRLNAQSPTAINNATDRSLVALLNRFGAKSIEHWSAATWEAFALQALWRVVRDGVHDVPPPTDAAQPNLRGRDWLLSVTGEDADWLVNDLLIRFCGAFLDQGFATCPLPNRDQGFFRAFCELYRQRGTSPDRWRRDLAGELARWENLQATPLDCILESLDELGIAEYNWEEFISQTFLALRGWGGMIRQMALRDAAAVQATLPQSIVEFLAVRLLLDRLAWKHLAKRVSSFSGPLSELRQVHRPSFGVNETAGVDQRAFALFQLAQVLGWPPSVLHRLSAESWVSLVEEIEAFPEIERQRVLHFAYERRYRIQTLDGIQIASRENAKQRLRPEFQVVCCIDEREESFRRHLEEIAPQVQTFGAVGFFNLAMYYRGAADANFTPLCPISTQPYIWVQEEVAYSMTDVHRRRASARRALGAASHRVHIGSRSFAGGLIAAIFGMLASIPLVARIMFPRLTARVRRIFARFIQPPPVTQLQLERIDASPGHENRGIGLSLQEMVVAGEQFLRDIGMTGEFTRIVVVLGHGSSSLNNPHNSAYNCGACGGAAGGPNARAIARILNDPRVRFILAERGLKVPDETVFIGGIHNTCTDSVAFLDIDDFPPARLREFEAIRALIEQACNRNAHERCRRFQSAPLDLSFEEARAHVEERSEDLSQTRPECGHATNAVCYVGRRERVRGLYMDRRTFLVSYNPTKDSADSDILLRLLQAAVPVCAGINLEYYFSYVDPAGWGCGSKLPHNVTSLLGVMDGAASDLRTGLPWQMVEIHEPVRLLFVVETTPEAMMSILDRSEEIGRLFRNEWIQLAIHSPGASDIHVFVDGRLEPYLGAASELPRVGSSTEWYRGWRDHLGYALIESS
ncbi:MAG: DUF2309 domain-containing protein [Pirellulales bacterium]|nr:DUF2309 domain-containing protein [Pirellulales bacterium]